MAIGLPTDRRPLHGALDVRRVILTGIAGNICVLFTANDAYMRDLATFAPADCIVSNTPGDNHHALRQIGHVLKGNLAVSTRLRFRRASEDGAALDHLDREIATLHEEAAIAA